MKKTFVVAITGASGSIYGIRLVQALAHETGMDPDHGFLDFLACRGLSSEALTRIDIFQEDEIASAPASGSFVHHGMAVAPCSMKTLAAMAAGYADNLITRSCDVSLKEKRPLVLVPRETPFSLIHLENMTRLARAGAVILPPSPSFYTFPVTVEDLVDTVVARVLDHLGADHKLLARWGETA